MKNTIGYLIILTLPLWLLSFTYTTDCKKVKNGKFYYYSKMTREKVNIDRIDSLQMETVEDTGSSPLKCKIIWKSECSYDMYLNALSDSKLTGIDSMIATIPAHVEIIFIGDEYYVCIAKMEINENMVEYRDTMFYRN
jgi:hypothetical protein